MPNVSMIKTLDSTLSMHHLQHLLGIFHNLFFNLGPMPPYKPLLKLPMVLSDKTEYQRLIY